MLQEGMHRGEFIVSEANGSRSREEGVLASGNNLVAGTILGKLTANGNYTKYDPAADTGAEDVSGVLYDNVDATDGDKKAVVFVRDAEVNAKELTYQDGADDAEKATANEGLVALGIITR